jgi:hypothetical protein
MPPGKAVGFEAERPEGWHLRAARVYDQVVSAGTSVPVSNAFTTLMAHEEHVQLDNAARRDRAHRQEIAGPEGRGVTLHEVVPGSFSALGTGSSPARVRMFLTVVRLTLWIPSFFSSPSTFQYFAVPGNIPVLDRFRDEVTRFWHQSLRRRSQRHRLAWDRFGPLVDRYLPSPRVLHPRPNDRSSAKYPK